MKIFKVTFVCKNSIDIRDSHHRVGLWIVARSIDHAIQKGKRHARKNFDDRRATVESAELAGTVDVP